MLRVGFTRAQNSFNNSLTRLHIFFRTTAIHEPNHRWRLPKIRKKLATIFPSANCQRKKVVVENVYS